MVDDGSTDALREEFEGRISEKIRFFQISNSERGAARNFGASKSFGKYINFFDSDDRMLPNHLSEAFRGLIGNEVPILRFDYLIISEEGELKTCEKVKDPSSTIFFDNFISINSIFLRSDIVHDYRFCEDRKLASSEDWELWIRLAARFPFHHIDIATSAILVHEERSLLTIHPTRAMERDLLLIEKLSSDPIVMKAYGFGFRKFCAERYSFFMLGFSSVNFFNIFFSCSLRAVFFWPPVMLTRRFLAAMRSFLFSIGR